MNLLQGKSNQYLREAILEGSVEKARRYLTLKIGKADVAALTESGGFSMLHCACLVGNTQIAMMLLQYGADVLALTDDGYSALDLAIWRGHLQIIELLRSQGCVAPMKEPESLNGKVISHLGRKATVVFFEPSTSIRTSSLRGLYYEDKGEAKLVNLWAGTDYKIIGSNPYYEELRKFDYQYAEIPVTLPEDYDAMLQGALQGAAFFDNDSDSESDNEIEEIVEVRVPPGPLGVLLDSGIQECAVVHGFTNLPTGEKGPIEAHGDVYPGMYIMSINETNASLMSLQQVTQLLGKLARKEKLIRFAVFRPGSPRNRSMTDTASEASNQRTSITSSGSLPPPVPVSARPSTPSSGLASFSSRFANLAASVLDKKPPTPRSSITSSVDVGTPKGAECIHCSMPATAHSSEDCPYR
ncbi:hypothetical protein PRIC1_010966 [Phytophthora ramorum]|uniref:putative ankyrin repeat protein n=1 Tax=Phytophthora ramorum TaxID=164328 RepID=UPI0030A9118B|nr:putative ankyrin repeat protein [Phytophthora ramorum]KAH7501365.1 putative ankyrin repeat protein [Phytophthora ramorum]